MKPKKEENMELPISFGQFTVWLLPVVGAFSLIFMMILGFIFGLECKGKKRIVAFLFSAGSFLVIMYLLALAMAHTK